MIKANEAVVGRVFTRELRTPRGTEYEHDFVLTEEWMGKLFGDNLSIALQDLHPIPLSPEVLLKLGLTEHCEGNEYRIGLPLGNGTDLVIEVLQQPSGPYDALISDTTADQKPNHYSYLKCVRYAHQVQNLFLAISGEELNYTP